MKSHYNRKFKKRYQTVSLAMSRCCESAFRVHCIVNASDCRRRGFTPILRAKQTNYACAYICSIIIHRLNKFFTLSSVRTAFATSLCLFIVRENRFNLWIVNLQFFFLLLRCCRCLALRFLRMHRAHRPYARQQKNVIRMIFKLNIVKWQKQNDNGQFKMNAKRADKRNKCCFSTFKTENGLLKIVQGKMDIFVVKDDHMMMIGSYDK